MPIVEKKWNGFFTAENAESAEKRLHHGVARKVTDFQPRRTRRTRRKDKALTERTENTEKNLLMTLR